jgi:hypothetical protein
MTIDLLRHHVRPVYAWQETGVFDGWEKNGLQPTMKDVQHQVISKMKNSVDGDGSPTYPF